MLLDFESYNESLNEASGLQAEYQKYFKEILKDFGVNSPAKLSDEKKKEFFDKVKSGWIKGKGRKDKVNEDRYTSMMEDERDLKKALVELFKKGYVSKMEQDKVKEIVKEALEEAKN